jgi:PEP-CTERM motif-containing protein
MKKFGLSVWPALLLGFALAAPVTPAAAAVIDFTGAFTSGASVGQSVSGSFDLDLSAPADGSSNSTIATYSVFTHVSVLINGTTSTDFTADRYIVINSGSGDSLQVGTGTQSLTISNLPVQSALVPFTVSELLSGGNSELVDLVGAVGGFANNITLSSGVPEPSTWAMMILGFCGIGAMTYRRRKQSTSLTVV